MGKCDLNTVLHLTEAFDNHVEKQTVGDFMKFCEKYIVGENGQLIDQRFCPRITKEKFVSCSFTTLPLRLSTKSQQKVVCLQRLHRERSTHLIQLMNQSSKICWTASLIWTGDFILGDKDADGNDTYVIGEFNCSCVGVTQSLNLCPQVADAAIKVLDEHRPL